MKENKGRSKGGDKPNSGAPKQGVWGSPPEAIGCLVFEVTNSKV